MSHFFHQTLKEIVRVWIPVDKKYHGKKKTVGILVKEVLKKIPRKKIVRRH